MYKNASSSFNIVCVLQPLQCLMFLYLVTQRGKVKYLIAAYKGQF